ncbi:P-loop containing nucleoside triphosphate hydrolase protein [Pyrenochaeta sp. MPI-SDFR-AT-0127]|nr:P-loop containing nucleoside triphosphate hydrolase protein [Pyrenochaeta sp. MPI-SDFR-AT-0127]
MYPRKSRNYLHVMASNSISTTFTGPENSGVQVGSNSGLIHVAFAERPETPPRPSCFIPFRRDPDFVDRGTLLDQICERCSAPASRVALVGLGGVGKSQLAIEYCYRTAERSPGTWVFWAHASNAARLEQSFREIAVYVKARGLDNPTADVFKTIHDWLRCENNGPWLLIIDNADDVAVLSPPLNNSQKSPAENGSNGDSDTLQQHLSRHLPPSKHGSVLLTSRTKLAAMQVVEDYQIVPIEPMQNTVAHTLLRKKLGDNVERDDSIAELAMVLEYIPLALVQAVTYIRERAPRCSISLLNQEAGHLRRDEKANNSVLITWQISFNHIRRKRQSAADLLSLMSFFDRQGIPEALLRNQSGIANDLASAVRVDDGFEEDILILRDYSFISIARCAKSFEMHSLVQLATRKWLEDEGQIEKWREQFISNMCAQLPTDEANLMSTMSMEVRREIFDGYNTQTLSSMMVVSLAKGLAGQWEEAEKLGRMSLEGRITLLGPGHPDTLTSRINLGATLQGHGKYNEAESMIRQALAQCKELLWPEHPSTLMVINNLANVLGKQRKYIEAELMYRETLDLQIMVRGQNHPDTLTSMGNLAARCQTGYQDRSYDHPSHDGSLPSRDVGKPGVALYELLCNLKYQIGL